MHISEKEQQFITYWEANRDKDKKLLKQLAWGIPSGIIFASLIMLNLLVGWDKQVMRMSPSLFITVSCGILGVAVFYGLMKMRIRWEKKEQYYKIIQSKTQSNETKRT